MACAKAQKQESKTILENCTTTKFIIAGGRSEISMVKDESTER